MTILSQDDRAAHRRSVGRRRAKQRAFESRVAAVRDPAQLKEFILKEIVAEYRGGEDRIHLKFEMPVTNFFDWALQTEIIAQSDGEDMSLIKQHIRHELMRRTRTAVRKAIRPGIMTSFESRSTPTGIEFELRLSLRGV